MSKGAFVCSLCLCLATTPAQAESTMCSNPKRARVLATATLSLPDDGIDRLDKWVSRSAKNIGMTTWGVESSNKGKRESQTIGLQSPKVSVSIEAYWKPGWRMAKVTVVRTCINDDLEPWSGYWAAFKREMRKGGFAFR